MCLYIMSRAVLEAAGRPEEGANLARGCTGGLNSSAQARKGQGEVAAYVPPKAHPWRLLLLHLRLAEGGKWITMF